MRSKPARIRSSVVLPLPEGPRIAVNEPTGTSRSTPRNTGWVLKLLNSPATRTPLDAATAPARSEGSWVGTCPTPVQLDHRLPVTHDAAARAGRRSKNRPST